MRKFSFKIEKSFSEVKKKKLFVEALELGTPAVVT